MRSPPGSYLGAPQPCFSSAQSGWRKWWVFCKYFDSQSYTIHIALKSENKSNFKKHPKNSNRHIFSIEYTKFFGANTASFRLNLWNLEQIKFLKEILHEKFLVNNILLIIFEILKKSKAFVMLLLPSEWNFH